MTKTLHTLAAQFISGLSAGDLPEALLAEDMQAWTTPSGAWFDRDRYRQGVQLLGALYLGGLRYTADSVTAEADRIAIEAHCEGQFADNGEPFGNRYVFMLAVRDGRIAQIAEHCDPRPVEAAIRPRLIAMMQQEREE